ncbi:hypothetical protein, partial [Metallosphaera sp.]|uniref:hypothetical protein n=1 Tax=Metallosphaera sp. TaxID=2020860 RepID=UPI00319EA88B
MPSTSGSYTLYYYVENYPDQKGVGNLKTSVYTKSLASGSITLTPSPPDYSIIGLTTPLSLTWSSKVAIATVTLIIDGVQRNVWSPDVKNGSVSYTFTQTVLSPAVVTWTATDTNGYSQSVSFQYGVNLMPSEYSHLITVLQSSNATHSYPISITGAPPAPVYSYPITITGAPSGSGYYQQMITLSNPSQYGINSQYSNFYITTSSDSPLYTWIESANSSKLVMWTKMPNGTTSADLEVFGSNVNNFNSTGYLGEAPQLSPTYGEYDNGAKVFINYWNFAGTTLPSGFTTAVGSTSSITQNNGITITSNQNVPGAYLQYNTEILSTSVIADSYSAITSVATAVGYSAGVGWFTNVVTSGNPSYTMGIGSVGTSGTSIGITGYNGSNPTSSQLATTSSTYKIWSLWAVGDVYYATVNYTNQVSVTVSSNMADEYLALAANSNGPTVSFTTYWLRTRAYLPNGMPTYSIGSGVGSHNSSLPTGTGYYQQLFTLKPSTYGINSAGSNVLFSLSNGTNLYAWIQSINSTSMSVWVKVPYGTSQIDMNVYPSFENLLSSTGYLGEAPQLSPTWGEYNNYEQVGLIYIPLNASGWNFHASYAKYFSNNQTEYWPNDTWLSGPGGGWWWGPYLKEPAGSFYVMFELKITGTSSSITVDHYQDTDSLSGVTFTSTTIYGTGSWNLYSLQGAVNLTTSKEEYRGGQEGLGSFSTMAFRGVYIAYYSPNPANNTQSPTIASMPTYSIGSGVASQNPDLPNGTMQYYQQLFTFKPSTYGINSAGSNVMFSLPNGTNLYAWIQSINSTSMNVWVKVPYGTTQTDMNVYPQFENLLSSTGYLGENPTIQTGYDNGLKVFQNYTTGITLGTSNTNPTVFNIGSQSFGRMLFGWKILYLNYTGNDWFDYYYYGSTNRFYRTNSYNEFDIYDANATISTGGNVVSYTPSTGIYYTAQFNFSYSSRYASLDSFVGLTGWSSFPSTDNLYVNGSHYLSLSVIGNATKTYSTIYIPYVAVTSPLTDNTMPTYSIGSPSVFQAAGTTSSSFSGISGQAYNSTWNYFSYNIPVAPSASYVTIIYNSSWLPFNVFPSSYVLFKNDNLITIENVTGYSSVQVSFIEPSQLIGTNTYDTISYNAPPGIVLPSSGYINAVTYQPSGSSKLYTITTTSDSVSIPYGSNVSVKVYNPWRQVVGQVSGYQIYNLSSQISIFLNVSQINFQFFNGSPQYVFLSANGYNISFLNSAVVANGSEYFWSTSYYSFSTGLKQYMSGEVTPNRPQVTVDISLNAPPADLEVSVIAYSGSNLGSIGTTGSPRVVITISGNPYSEGSTFIGSEGQTYNIRISTVLGQLLYETNVTLSTSFVSVTEVITVPSYTLGIENEEQVPQSSPLSTEYVS